MLGSKHLFKIAGSGVALLALVFVFRKFWAHRHIIFEQHISPYQFFILFLCSVIYALICNLLSLAWFRLLKWRGQSDISLLTCLRIYARTQIAKYLPGNVFHLGGRHALGYNAGINHAPLVGAALYEMAGLLAASGTFAILGMVFLEVSQQYLLLLKISAIMIAMIFFPLILNMVATRCQSLKGLSVPAPLSSLFFELLPVYLLYILFFLISGSIFFVVTKTVAQNIFTTPQLGSVLTAFSLSWIAGFVTPGAPGGAGIREAIQVGALAPLIGEPESLLTAIIFRMITILGDLLFFLSSFGIMANRIPLTKQKS